MCLQYVYKKYEIPPLNNKLNAVYKLNFTIATLDTKYLKILI